MHFLCLAYEEEKVLNDLSREEWTALRSETLAYVEALEKSGRLILTNALQSARTAATVRVRSGRLSVLDGPYAETKEQLGGFFLIEAKDLADAIQVASRWPSARLGSIEVRPVEEELAEERRRGNCIERVLRVTARHYVIDPAALGSLAAGEPGRLQDRFSATYLIALAARAIRELAALREGAAKARKRLATFSMEAEIRLAAPADFRAFAEDLARAVAGLAARYQDDRPGDGRRFRLVLGAYPVPRNPSDTKPGTNSGPGRTSRREES